MPRERRNEDATSRNNRYIPFARRLQLDMPTPPSTPPPPMANRESEEQRHGYIRRCPKKETPMTIFHSKVVEILHCKVQNKELELVSDAETLTADEGSDSSNDSWTTYESTGSADVPKPLDLSFRYDNVFPKVIVLPMPQLEPLEEPMEIVDEHAIPGQQLQPLVAPYADENDGDLSESSSTWSSDDDEEIQRACLRDTEEESDEEGNSESSSGRVNHPEVYHPKFYRPLSQPPTPPTENVWAAGSPQPPPTENVWAAGSPQPPAQNSWPGSPTQSPELHPVPIGWSGSPQQSPELYPVPTGWSYSPQQSPELYPVPTGWSDSSQQSPELHPVPTGWSDSPQYSPELHPVPTGWSDSSQQSPELHPVPTGWSDSPQQSLQEQPISSYWPVERTDFSATYQTQTYSSIGLMNSGWAQPVAVSIQEQSTVYTESTVELMDQDDHDTYFEEASRVYEPLRPIIQYSGDREFNYLYYPQYEPSGYFSNNNLLEAVFLPRPVTRCHHCGSSINQLSDVPNTTLPDVGASNQPHLTQYETRPSTCTDFSIRHLLSPDNN